MKKDRRRRPDGFVVINENKCHAAHHMSQWHSVLPIRHPGPLYPG